MCDRTTLRLIAAFCVLAIGGCGDSTDGFDAYADGRFEEAHAHFAALDTESPAAESALNRALAAVRAGALEDAEVSARRALTSDDADHVARAEFLVGNVEYERARIASRQADGPELEPFGFDVAIGHARSARAAWISAATTATDWPAARRNIERASRLLAELERRKAEAEGRPNKTEPDKPKPAPTAAQLDPQPDDEGDGEGTDETGTATAVRAALTEQEVLELLDVLAARERAKRAMRIETRRERSVDVESDW